MVLPGACLQEQRAAHCLSAYLACLARGSVSMLCTMCVLPAVLAEAALSALSPAGLSSNKTYVKQLFQLVRQTTRPCAPPQQRAAMLASLPWMVGQYCSALRQYKQAADTGAESYTCDTHFLYQASSCWFYP
jgi:hypothetical protein